MPFDGHPWGRPGVVLPQERHGAASSQPMAPQSFRSSRLTSRSPFPVALGFRARRGCTRGGWAPPGSPRAGMRFCMACRTRAGTSTRWRVRGCSMSGGPGATCSNASCGSACTGPRSLDVAPESPGGSAPRAAAVGGGRLPGCPGSAVPGTECRGPANRVDARTPAPGVGRTGIGGGGGHGGGGMDRSAPAAVEHCQYGPSAEVGGPQTGLPGRPRRQLREAIPHDERTDDVPVEMGIWRVDTPRPQRLSGMRLPSEEELETFLAEDPSLLGDPLLIIGRQVRTDFGT